MKHGLIDFKKYFIVGTNQNALHDTMNGTVTGELIRCKDCRNFLENWRCLKWSAFARPEGYCYKAERKKYEKG